MDFVLTPWGEALLTAWVGAGFGSFLNVVAYRLPRGESVVRPRSRCPKCKRPIAAYDNIPVLSWLILGGRCRHCRRPISKRYPLVEAAAGLLSAALWLKWRPHPAFAAAAVLASCALLAISLIDWDTFLIPDELSLGLLGAGWLAAPINPLLGPGAAPAFLASFGGALAGGLLCWGTAAVGERIFGKEAMGGGDVKLLAAVGAWTGPLGAYDCLILASLLGSVYGVGLMALGRLRRADPIPFGPFLAAGAVFNLFLLLPWGFPFV